MQTLSDSCNLVLYFSLPFKLKGMVSPFFFGHISVSLEGTLYHIVNPQLLRSNFLFSIMPVHDWLFGAGGTWVERDPASPMYRHVYLYRKCESKRTVIYGAGLQVAPSIIQKLQNDIDSTEKLFRSGALKFDFVKNNCSSMIASLFADAGLIPSAKLNAVPSLFFKRFISFHRDSVSLGRCGEFDESIFSIRKYCLGLWSLNPIRSMDQVVNSFPVHKIIISGC
jgi:hypothetical protein